jgi:ribonuclease Z
VDHGPHDKPAFGCRIDYDGRSVLISGDTRFNENVGGNGQLGRSKEL